MKEDQTVIFRIELHYFYYTLKISHKFSAHFTQLLSHCKSIVFTNDILS